MDNAADVVDQIIVRYDPTLRALAPVATTLPDSALVSDRFLALVDAPYRTRDAGAAPGLSVVRVPDDPTRRTMIVRRAPDASSGRLAVGAHVLVGTGVDARTGLGLADWDGWFPTGELPDTLEPIPQDHLQDLATPGFRRLSDAAREPGVRQELARFVDALLRAGDGRLTVVGHSADPLVLLAGARAILGSYVSADWAFGVGEAAQQPDVRISFLLPDVRAFRGQVADLTGYPPQSDHLEAAHVLVSAYRRYPDAAAWETARQSADVYDAESLLAWAYDGAASDAEPREREIEQIRRHAQEADGARHSLAQRVVQLEAEQAALEEERERLRQRAEEAERATARLAATAARPSEPLPGVDRERWGRIRQLIRELGELFDVDSGQEIEAQLDQVVARARATREPRRAAAPVEPEPHTWDLDVDLESGTFAQTVWRSVGMVALVLAIVVMVAMAS